MSMASAVTERGTWGTSPSASRPRPPSPLTSDQHQPFPIPATEAQCDAMLASSESRAMVQPELVRQALVADLSRFLGAASRVWTQARRVRLHKILVAAGWRSITPVLQAVAACPRDEVLDDAVAVLAVAADLHDEVGEALVAMARAYRIDTGAEPGVREVLLRAVARTSHPRARYARVAIAYDAARIDPSPAVRDAAVQALSMMGMREGSALLIDLLEKLRPAETSPIVIQSLDEAIETLREY